LDYEEDKAVGQADLATPRFVLITPKQELLSANETDAPPRLSKAECARRGLIHPGMKEAEVLSAFRDLRTTIMPQLQSFNSVLQVSAVCAGGGASFSALNLAISCTFDQHRNALVVDCNFDHPSLADKLDVSTGPGLYDYLTGQIGDIRDIIYKTPVPRLSLVPAGAISADEDHIEFFTGENMRVFIDDVRNRYDDRIIILDAPPVLDSSDGKILAEVVDHTVLVLPYKGVTPSKINKAIKAIGRQKIVGMVLNN